MGKLSLHGACSAGASVSIVKTLLDAASATLDDKEEESKNEKEKDITQVKDLDGLTPIDYVERSSHPHKSSLLYLLEEYGKNSNHNDDDFLDQKNSSTLPPVVATHCKTTT